MLAIEGYQKRISDLIDATIGFREVLITCRTQFFTRDEEIPLETGLLKFSPTRAGDSKLFVFHKLYLSPFTDQQVSAYLRRFPRRSFIRTAKSLWNSGGNSNCVGPCRTSVLQRATVIA